MTRSSPSRNYLIQKIPYPRQKRRRRARTNTNVTVTRCYGQQFVYEWTHLFF